MGQSHESLKVQNLPWQREKRRGRRSQRDGECEDSVTAVLNQSQVRAALRLGDVRGALFWAAGKRPPKSRTNQGPPGETNVAVVWRSVWLEQREGEGRWEKRAGGDGTEPTGPAGCGKDLL